MVKDTALLHATVTSMTRGRGVVCSAYIVISISDSRSVLDDALNCRL